MTPKISIIIPTYQHAKELPKCLNSIFSQSFRDTEIIVVNDGSTDETESVLRSFGDKITVLTQPNRGSNNARNRGAAAARGEYLLFCDADVVMRPDMLEKMAAALEAHPEASYAYSSFNFGWKRFSLRPFDAATLKAVNYIHTTSLLRRSAFPGFDESIKRLQDWDLWLTMLAQSRVGVWIPEVLFTVLPHRGGISTWLPGMFYRVPWKSFGIHFASIDKYQAAEEIVRKKHALDKITLKSAIRGRVPRRTMDTFKAAFCMLLLIVAASYVGYTHDDLNAAFFIGITATTFALTFFAFDIAFLIVIAELAIGSQGGHLFWWSLNAAHDVPLRMALFASLLGGWAIRMVVAVCAPSRRATELGWLAELRRDRLLWPYVAMLGMIAGGMLIGLMRGNGASNVYLDSSGFFYFALLPAFFYARQNGATEKDVVAVASAAVGVSLLEAFTVLFVFSHRLVPVAREVYSWVRDDRIGEITIMIGDVYRVFFQAHVFALALLFVCALPLALSENKKTRRWLAAAFTACTCALLMGLSRSFWFGIVCGGLTAAALLLRAKVSPAVWKRAFAAIAIAVAASVIALSVIIAFPYPTRGGRGSLAELFSSRLFSLSGEAAVNSRWSLLPKLIAATKQHPIIGNGFGKTVTYTTSDPRLLAEFKNGQYTTYRFEWGYNDLVVKVGIIGLLIYAWFVFRIMAPYAKRLRTAIAAKSYDVLARDGGIVAAMIALLATNVFSPYHNHPLGIGLLMLAAMFGASRSAADALP